ncbi:MAG TPA: LPO_1073/Vpar_1526 family protein [Pyrinomonadaceae bacterium]|nr:LPO_1073/Vpar_1526 family protein [Pyrinomonadaceae bacterium]
MIGDKQSQVSGDESVNIQAKEITFGLSYTEARQVAMDVFEANFFRLRNIAAEVARKRAEAFLDSYLQKMADTGKEAIPEAENPDFQYALYSAQREYARTGDEQLGELLVRLLVDRTKESERNLMQIVLNESLTVAPKLTGDQLDILSIIFIHRYTKNNGLNNLDTLKNYLERLYIPFLSGLNTKASTYQHLEFASCGTISMGGISFGGAFRQNYPGLFSKGFTQEELQSTGLDSSKWPRLITSCLHNPELLQVGTIDNELVDKIGSEIGIDVEILEKLKGLQNSKLMSEVELGEYVVNVRPEINELLEVWNNSSMKNLTLTSVGIAIAHANVQRRVPGESINLSIWI